MISKKSTKKPKKKKVAKKKDKDSKKRSHSDYLDDSFYTDPKEELTKKGIYYITDMIETDSLLAIQQDVLLKHLDPKWEEDIQIMVNSCGGSVPEMWALIDLLQWIRMDVCTTGLGDCASAGACLLSCGTPGKRLCAPNTSIMVHGAQLFMFGRNDRKGLASISKMMEDEHEKDIKFWIKHSKYTTKKQIEEKFLNGEDHWFTAMEALKHGLVDEVVGHIPAKKKG